MFSSKAGVHPIGAHFDRLCCCVEAGKLGGCALDVTARHGGSRDQLIEHAACRQPLHAHEPLHDLAGRSKRKLSRLSCMQWSDADVDVFSEPGVEARLLKTVRPSCLEGCEIKKGISDRLLQLVDQFACQEHP